jgi:hypothetical protein
VKQKGLTLTRRSECKASACIPLRWSVTSLVIWPVMSTPVRTAFMPDLAEGQAHLLCADHDLGGFGESKIHQQRLRRRQGMGLRSGDQSGWVSVRASPPPACTVTRRAHSVPRVDAFRSGLNTIAPHKVRRPSDAWRTALVIDCLRG